MTNQGYYKTDTILLKKKMIDCGFDTVKALSDHSGVNYCTLTRVVKGKSQPSSHTMMALYRSLLLNEQEAGTIFFSSDLHNA